jgi:hypothetical protein
MRVVLAGNTFLLKGRFTPRRAEVEAQIVAAGGKVSKSMTQRTKYLVRGEIDEYDFGYLKNEANAKSIRILDADQLRMLLIEGEITIADPEDPPKHATARQEGEAFATLKALCSGELTDEAWHRICLELDQCAEDAQAVATDVVLELLAGHELTGDPRKRRGDRGATVESTPCFQPCADWMAEILRGENASKLRIVRELTLFDKKLTGKTAKPLFECTNLCNVEVLNLGGNKLPARFWKQLATAEQFQRVTELYLCYSAFDDRAAQSLGQPDAFPQVTTLDLSSGNLSGGGVLAGLFGQGGFGALERLDISGSQLGAGEIEALGAAKQLTSLRRLRLSSYQIDAEGLVKALVGATGLRLDELDLSGFDFTEDQLAMLVKAPHLANARLVT